MANGLKFNNSPVAPKLIGVGNGSYSQQVQQQTQSPGQTFAQQYLARRNNSAQFDQTQKLQNTQSLAQDVANKSAGYVPTDQYGVVQTPKQDQNPVFGQSLDTIQNIGATATQAAQDKARWQQIKKLQDLQASYNVDPIFKVSYDPATLPPGANPNNPGAKAVAYAITAYQNHTPYVWGGNSLTKGVDCSGLVQQVYGRLGISIPRTSYEQAKSGKIVNLRNLLPGDLVFYNTGASDPNGIGRYSHVAIYVGNGMIVDARNTRSGIKYSSINNPGSPVLGVRPW